MRLRVIRLIHLKSCKSSILQSECLKYDLPFAYFELYELLYIAARMFHENIYLIGLSSNPEIYREKALEIAKQFKWYCSECAYNKNMQKYVSTYRVQGDF